ncbi:hypothetical protein SAMN02927924_03619 [Sphingobium faniae]|nr:hypothetical protein SAMN02927924_03619 [Sphingobium faniae]
MYQRPSHPKAVLLMLHDDASGAAWQLRLSDDCLRFIGRYKRVDGFQIEAMMLVEGLRKSG